MKTNHFRLLMLLLSLMIASAALASPYWEFEQTYFTDATHDTVCGYYHQYCQSSNRSGCLTTYYVVEYFDPCGYYTEEPNECNDGFDNDGDGNRDQWDFGCAWDGTERSM